MAAEDRLPHLTKEEIMNALGRLSDLPAEAGVIGEVCLFGGTVMALVFNARLSTRDVDAIFKPAPLVRELAEKIARERELPLNRLNDGVKGFQANHPEITTESVPQFPNLRVYRPSAEYLLAMKCLAARANSPGTSGDKNDIMLLVKHLGLRTAEKVEPPNFVASIGGKHSFADKCVPKCNLGTREKTAPPPNADALGHFRMVWSVRTPTRAPKQAWARLYWL